MEKRRDPHLLRWLKQQAKFLKRERGISHSEALEVLAEREGFLDYEEARRILSGKEPLRAWSPKGGAGIDT